MRTIVAEACAGKRSLRELADISLAESLLRRVNARTRSLLESETPERIELDNAR